MRITDDLFIKISSMLILITTVSYSSAWLPKISDFGHFTELLSNRSDPRVRVHFVSFVAYYVPFVIAAIQVAVEDARRRNPEINFTYSTYWNPSDPSCDAFDGAVTDHLAHYYYKLKEDPDLYAVVLSTGCRRGTTGMAELAREWNIPVVVSAGRGSELQNKKRYPSLVGLMPADFRPYAHVFRHLLDWYKWRTVTIICDPLAVDMEGTSYNNDYRQICDTWAKVINNSGNNYRVFTVTADLSQEHSRRKVLLEVQTWCRVIVIITHMDRLRRTMVEAYRLNMTTPEYVHISFCSYNVPDSFEGTPHWWRNDSLDREARLAFDSLLIATLASPPPSKELDIYYETVRKTSLEMFNTTDFFPDNGKIFGVATHTAVHVTTQVFAESLQTCSRDLHEGAFFAKSLANRTFSSLEGPCKLNANGNRDSVYAVIGATNHSDVFDEVFHFDSADGRFYASPRRKTWIGHDTAPPDRPLCGYRGDEFEGPCGAGLSSALVSVGIVLAAFVILTIPFAATMLITRRRSLRQIARLCFLDPTVPLVPFENDYYSFSFSRPSNKPKSSTSRSWKSVRT